MSSGSDNQASKQSGLKAPSKISRPGGIPKPVASSTSATSVGALTTSTTSTTSTASMSTLNMSQRSHLTNATASSNVIDAATVSHNTTINDQDADEDARLMNEFKLGDRVVVNGSKSGTIAFMGPTQFKEGIWAGIILDTNDGKNNGSLNGVTYFRTDENRGVFCRLNKLSKLNETNQSQQQQQQAANITLTTGLKIGDKVVVISGNVNKVGILRYIGTTDFAKGEWAGIELEEKIGKNDGSVGGKRYFQCEPLYGVFAQAQKVEPYSPAAQAQSTPQRQSLLPTSSTQSINKLGTNVPVHSKLASAQKLAQRQTSGSQESLVSEKSSVYSTTSSSLLKTKLTPTHAVNVTSNLQQHQKNLTKTTTTAVNKTPTAAYHPTSTPIPKKPIPSSSTASSQPVLQQSLREKEGHIQQLLKERDFERAEFTRAAQKFEQTEAKLIEYAKLLQEKDQEMAGLYETVKSLQENKSNLLKQHDTDRTKIEDLEFQIEEHKLGCVKASTAGGNEDEITSTSTPVTRNEQQPQEIADEKELVMQQLKLQQDIAKNHLEEIKFLKEQIDTLNIDLKQSRLAEEVYDQEKREMKKRIDQLESEMTTAQQDAQEAFKLKEQVKDLELRVKFLSDEGESTLTKLNARISELADQLQQSETQKSEIEFVYEELKAKLEEKDKELIQLRSNQSDNDLEFALEEQKILVQELESKLNTAQTANEQQTAQLTSERDDLLKNIDLLKNDMLTNEAKLSEANSQRDEALARLEKELSDINRSKTEQVEELNAQLRKLNEEKVELQEMLSQNQISNNTMSENTKLIDELNEKLRQTEENLSETKHLNTELLTKLDASNDELKQLDEKLKQFEITRAQDLKSSEDLSIQLKQSNDEIKQLKEKLNQGEVTIDECKKANNDLQARLSELMQNSGDHSAQLLALNESIKDKDKLIENLQASLGNLDVQLKSANENVQSGDEKLKGVEEKCSNLENENKQLNDQINKLKENVDMLQTEKNDLAKQDAEKQEAYLSKLNEQLSESNKQIAEIGEQLAVSNKHVTELKEQILRDQQSYDENLKRKQSELDDTTKNSLALINEEKLNLTKQVTELNTQIEAFKNELSEAKSVNQKLINENETKLRELNEQASTDLEKKLAEFKIEKENLMQKVEDLMSSNEKMTIEMASIREERESLLSQRDKMTSEYEMLKNEKISLLDEKEKLHQQIASTHANNQNAANETIEKLTKELEEAKEKTAELEEKNSQQIKDYESTIGELKSLIQQNEEANETKTNEINEYRAQLETYELELNNHRDLITEYEQENEVLRTELEALKLGFGDEDIGMRMQVNDANENDGDESASKLAGKFKLASAIKPAPRLFCDICDEFDLHDTEDCPKQSMGNVQELNNEKETHSSYNLIKSTNRAYCDICEQFGHDEEFCPTVKSGSGGTDTTMTTTKKSTQSDEEF